MTQRYIGGLIYNPPGGYSGYFDGSGDYLTGPSNAAFAFGTGNLTVEFWLFTLSTPGVVAGIYDVGTTNTSGRFVIDYYSDQKVKIETAGSTIVASSTNLPLNSWVHIAAVRSGTTMSLYQNGIRVGTATDSTNFSQNSPWVGQSLDGYAYNGYISNLRVVKGTAVYDPTQTSITVPNGPLQNITNTSLLTCRYPTFVDGSSNAFTITVNGNTTVSTQNPFPLTTLPNPAQGGAGNGIFSMSQYQSLKQQNLWPAIDPYFDYTTLLLHGNGTNGGQNNTFLDSGTANSGSGFTITRNGNTTQGTFSPFSQTGWSNYFDGSGDYLQSTLTGQTFGTGDFTVEFWVKFDSIANTVLLDTRVSGDSSSTWAVQIYNNNLSWEGSGVANLSIPTSQLQLSTWMHFAYTRVSGVMRVYMNGVQYGSTASVTNNYTSTRLDIGGAVFASISWLSGYMSNVRLVKGSAVYTGNFTPPTAPLTAISGTVFLSCQSNRFVDNSSSAFSISVGGTPSVQAFSPFAPTTAYSASTVGGSGYFDGSGDYLQYPVITLGSSDVTAECWVYLNSLGNQEIFGINYNSDQSSYGAIRVQIASNTLRFMGTTSGSSFAFGPTSASKTPAIGEWAHIAVVRSGTTFTLYLNGTSVATATGISGSLYAGTFGGRVGSIYWSGGNDYLNGYISNFRIVAGTAVYTGAFTPPTAPLSTSGSASSSAYPSTTNVNTSFASSECSLLLNFTNAAIIDNTAKNVLETVGNAQISTTQSKFGGASLAFDGSGDYLVGLMTPNLVFGSGNMTFEFWVYANTISGFDTIFDTRTSGGYGNESFSVYLDGGVPKIFAGSYSGASPVIAGSSAISTSTWTHIAFTRSSGTNYLFVNGTSITSNSNSWNQTLVTTNNFRIGDQVSGDVRPLDGYIDDLRITKGIARYTSNFTPQTSQWQDQ